MSSAEYERLLRQKYYLTNILPQREARRLRGADNYIVKLSPEKAQQLIALGKENDLSVYGTPAGKNETSEAIQENPHKQSTKKQNELPMSNEATTADELDEVTTRGTVMLLRRASELEKLGEDSTAEKLKEVQKKLEQRSQGECRVEETLEPEFVSVRLVIHQEYSEPDFRTGTTAFGYGKTTEDALRSAVEAALVQLNKMDG